MENGRTSAREPANQKSEECEEQSERLEGKTITTDKTGDTARRHNYFGNA